MSGHIEVEHLAATMLQDQENEQDPQRIVGTVKKSTDTI
jgi:hypothetical protein